MVFVSAHATGDPARLLLPAEASTSEDYERMQRALGLDKPLMTQYGLFVVNAVQGDFGVSIQHRRPVSELLIERISATLELAFPAIVLSIVIGIPLGVVSAIRRDSVFDMSVKGSTIVGMAAPQFWVGIMLIILFSTTLGWLPAYGRGGIANLFLPVVTLSLAVIAGIVRLARSSMLEVMESDFIKFARMRGVNRSRLIWKHALMNALIPVITFIGIMMGVLLSGTIVVEQVFAWPGLGRLTLDAVVQRNFPVIQGAVLLGGCFYILSAFIADILYALVDPRIRYG